MGSDIRRDAAALRVDRTLALHPYRDLLIDYTGDDQDWHLSWVMNASPGALMRWAEAVRNGENPERGMW